jgi:hypothetical protein
MDEREREIRERLDAVTRVRPEGFIENIGATIAAETFVTHAVADVEHLLRLLDAERATITKLSDMLAARSRIDGPAARAAAIEECAKVCDESARESETMTRNFRAACDDDGADKTALLSMLGRSLAARIRALLDTEGHGHG